MDHLVALAAGPVDGPRRVPPSKSLYQRALVLAHLAEGDTRIDAAGLAGDDVAALARSLETLGRWQNGALGGSRESLAIHLGLGATGFRFALAAATLRPVGARTLVTGYPPLLARPHGGLVRALRSLGGRLKRRHSGSYRVHGGGLESGRVDVAVDVSSQFASALLLVAPRVGGLDVRLRGDLVSRPYLDLTLSVLEAFGVKSEEGEGRIQVEGAQPRAGRYQVEADASSAAPWWAAAALTGGKMRILGLPASSGQADVRLLDLLPRTGADVYDVGGLAEVRGRGERLAGMGEVDLRRSPDLLPLVGILAAGANGETVIRGAGHARFKESDRLATVAAGIEALGGDAAVHDDVLVVRGRALRGGTVQVAHDHRIALAFGVLGLIVPGVRLRGAEAVSKSYPSFFEELASAAGHAQPSGG